MLSPVEDARSQARVLHYKAPASGQKTQKGLLIVLFSTKGGRGGDSGEPLPKMDGGLDAMMRACECYRYSGLGVIWQYQPPAPYALQKVS